MISSVGLSANMKNHSKILRQEDKNSNVKETKGVYGKLMVITRSGRDINLEESIGNH